MLIYSSPRLIAVSHVLLRLLMPRHSPYALFRLNFLNWFLQSIMRCPSSQIIILRLCYSPYFALLAKFVVINYTITERPSDFCHTFSFQGIKKWSFLNYLFVSNFSLFGFQWTAHGDFIAWWRRSGSNRLPLECHSSALPGELRPRDELCFQVWSLEIEQRIDLNLDGLGCYIKYAEVVLRLSSTFRTLRTFSIERRWSSRTFRYGYLVTT